MMIHLFEIFASLTESALGIAVPAKLLGEKRSGGIRLAAAAGRSDDGGMGDQPVCAVFRLDNGTWSFIDGSWRMSGLPEEFCGRAAADCIFYVSFVCL